MNHKIIIALFLLIMLSSCDFASKKELTLEAGNDNISLNEDWVDSGAYIMVDGTKKFATATHNIDNSIVGEYIVNYTLIENDVEYNAKRYVWVHDRERPVVSLNKGVDTIIKGTSWIDAGVSVSDNYTLDLVIQVEGSVDTTQAGTYIISYTVTDESKNFTTIARVVTVLE